MAIPLYVIGNLAYLEIIKILDLEATSQLDGFFGPFIAMIIMCSVGYAIFTLNLGSGSQMFYITLLIVILLFDIGYSLFFKRDPGKQCMELRIYNDKGGKPNSIQIIVRSMLKYLSLVFAPYLLLIVSLNKKARGLYDYIARTYVDGASKGK